MGDEASLITANLARIRERVAEAARRAGRDESSVKLVAVSKGHSIEDIQTVAQAGVHDFGENRVQELLDKAATLRDQGHRLTWHMIGSLQTNKVKALVRECGIVHSLDRSSLAAELSRRAGERPDLAAIRVLLEINVSGEASKAGVPPSEAPALLNQVAGLPGLEVVGLMTMAPASPRPDESRAVFRALAKLRDSLNSFGLPGVQLRELSMGMSQDFEVAVEEGATIIRVGSALFGARNRRL